MEDFAAKWADTVTSKCLMDRDVMVIYGIEDGKHIKLVRSMFKGGIIAYQPSKFPILAKEDLEGVVVTDSIKDIFNILDNVDVTKSIISVFAWPETVNRDKGLLEWFNENFKRFMEYLIFNTNTERAFLASWNNNIIKNYKHMIENPSIVPLRGAMKGKTIVIPSPGPSLPKALPKLKEMQDRVIIIAPTQSLRPLRKAGIKADIIIMNDTANFIYNFDDDFHEYYAVMTSVGNPNLVEKNFKGKWFYYNHRMDAYKVFESYFDKSKCDDGYNIRSISWGNTVSCAAFSLAVFCGAKNIITIGHDLAFADDGNIYCENAPDYGTKSIVEGNIYKNEFAEAKQNLIDVGNEFEDFRTKAGNICTQGELAKVPGYHGGEVNANITFKQVLQWYNYITNETDFCKESKLYNCTDGGAYISGFQHITIDEFFNKNEVDIIENKQNFLEHKIEKHDVTKFVKDFEEEIIKLNEIVVKAKRVNRHIRAAKGKITKSVKKHLARFSTETPYSILLVPLIEEAHIYSVHCNRTQEESKILDGLNTLSVYMYEKAEYLSKLLKEVLESIK